MYNMANHFPRDPVFDPEIIVDNDLSRLSDRSARLYGHWILELCQGHTFFGLNYEWPSNRWHRNLTVPKGFYDTYVFSWGMEDWDHVWLHQFCQEHKDSQVIVISDTELKEGYNAPPNLKCLVHHCWHVVFEDVISYDRTPFLSSNQREHRCSSLVNKPSYFKALTTAYLMMHHKESLLMSWNTNKNQEICGSLGFLNLDTPTAVELRPLIEYYLSHLKSTTISLDDFVVDRMQFYNSNHPAYTNCVVNFSNETYSQDAIDGVPMPGPYITEKSWKPLLGGAALMPVGRMQTYAYMENFGFCFDYPWNRSFDLIPGDIDRFVSTLSVIDKIFAMDMPELSLAVAESSCHNYYHIRSQNFLNRVKQINNEHLARFLNP